MAARDSSGTHVWLVLMKAYRSMERHAARSMEAHKLAFSDFKILEALLHKGPLLVNNIGRRIQLTSGAITTAVDRMEERRLVVRGSVDTDRRARRVSLTPAGRALITKVFEQHKARMDEAATGLDRGEREQLIDLLKKLGATAEAGLETGDG